jgi:hypothetical protein
MFGSRPNKASQYLGLEFIQVWNFFFTILGHLRVFTREKKTILCSKFDNITGLDGVRLKTNHRISDVKNKKNYRLRSFDLWSCVR